MKVPDQATNGARTAVLAFVVLLSAASAGARSLAPLRTQEARTLPSGTVEVIVGASYFRDQRFPFFTPEGTLDSQHLVTGPELALRIGAGSWAEVQASFEMIYLDEKTAAGESSSEFGNGDARLFTKVRLLRETAARPGIGVRFGAKLPNADRDKRLGTDETDFGIEALASKELGPVRAHVNLGLVLLGNPGPLLGPDEGPGSGQDDLFSYSAALALRPIGIGAGRGIFLQPMVEVNGLAGSRFDNDRAAARVGMQLRAERLAVYAGGSAGLVSGSEDFGVAGGLIYAFELERLVGPAD